VKRRILLGIVGSLGALALATDAGTARAGDQERSKKKMSSDDDASESLKDTVLRVGETDVTITLADAQAMREALRAYLKASDYPERDEVLVWTKGEASIDPDGSVRIGPWLLGAEDGEIILRYREPATALAMKAHRAVVEKKDGAWTVSRLEMERIRRR
jgi:hypothetical protein